MQIDDPSEQPTRAPDARGRLTSQERSELEAEIRGLLAARMIDAAAQRVVVGYGPEIAAYITNVMNNFDAANEVFGQFSEDLLRGLPTFEPRATIRTWAFCLARHAIARYYRDPFRKYAEPLSTGAAERLKAESESSSSPARRDIDESIAYVRRHLSAEDREILTLHLDRRLGWSEIATIVGISHAAARQRFHRVKDKARKLLKRRRGG